MNFCGFSECLGFLEFPECVNNKNFGHFDAKILIFRKNLPIELNSPHIKKMKLYNDNGIFHPKIYTATKSVHCVCL